MLGKPLLPRRLAKSFSDRMELSVIVPTYNEGDNIRPLCERVVKACKAAKITVEVLVMDDESVGSAKTKAIVDELAKEKYPISMHMRRKSEGRGLSSAVLLGFKKAKYSTVLCMDADLQHEPESVPAVALPVLKREAEFVVGSRYCEGGSFGFDWAIHRRLISSIATGLAFGVSRSSDPMSGFFCTTKQVIARGEGRTNPIGFKISLELMARCRADPVVDVPITFQNRQAGESKLTMKQNVQYIEQLAALYWDAFRGLIVMSFLVLALLISYAIRSLAVI